MNRVTMTSLILTLVFAISSHAADSEHTVSVTGKAEDNVKPDAAYVTVYAQADGILMVDAVKKVEKLVNEITSAVNAHNNILMNIEVTDVALGEKQTQYYRSDQEQKPASPQVTRRIRIRCKPEPEGIYEVIDKAIRAGALMQTPSSTRYSDDICSVVVYKLEQSAEVLDRVRQAAMADAKAEAKKSASLAGKSVGEVVKIGASGASHFRYPMRVMGQRADFPTEHLGTNPEGIAISHAVSVTFELKD